MAKKRKLKDEQERGFQFPEFDPDEYLRKERRDARITVVTLGYAFLFGLFSYAVALYGEAGVSFGLLVGFAGMFSLRWFHALAGIQVHELETKHIVGYSLLFLLTWLAVWVVLSNPPATDISEPYVDAVEVREWDAENRTWVAVAVPQAGQEYRVYSKVYDYGEVDTVTLEVRRVNSEESTKTMEEDPDGENWFYADDVTFERSSNQYYLVILVEDTAGNSTEHVHPISVAG